MYVREKEEKQFNKTAMNVSTCTSVLLVFIYSLFSFDCVTSSSARSPRYNKFVDFQRFKLEILETWQFSATFRFENVEIDRTSDYYFYYCVQVCLFRSLIFTRLELHFFIQNNCGN